MILFLAFIAVLILVILLVSLVTYFNSKNNGGGNKILGNDEITGLAKITNFNLESTIAVEGEGTINWGDGTIDTFTSKSKSILLNHTYSSVGDYQITIKGDILFTGLSGYDSGSNIRVYNLDIKNCKKLYFLASGFIPYDGGNTDKYFFTGLENCESLNTLIITDPQNIVQLPGNKLTTLRISNENGENHITGIQNLNSQLNLQSLRLSNIPTNVYSSEGIVDTSVFSSLTYLELDGASSNLDSLILSDSITTLILANIQNTPNTGLTGFNPNNYEKLRIDNILYFTFVTSIDFSGNTILSELSLNIYNDSNIDIVLPTQTDTLTQLELTFNEFTTNTVTDVNLYTNLISLLLSNVNMQVDILNISSLNKLESLYTSPNTYTDVQVSISIIELLNVNVSYNQMDDTKLNRIGTTLLNQEISGGSINMSYNPGSDSINLESEPWSVLKDTYNWEITNDV